MTFSRSLKHHKNLLLLRRLHMDLSPKPKYNVGQLKMCSPRWFNGVRCVGEIVDVDDNGSNTGMVYRMAGFKNGSFWGDVLPESNLSRVPFRRFLWWSTKKGERMIGFTAATPQLYTLMACAIVAILTQTAGGALVSQGWLNAISLFFGAGIPLIMLASHYYNWQKRCL